MSVSNKNETQELLKNAYIVKNVLSNKLVQAIEEEGNRKNFMTNRAKYPCLSGKKNTYNQKKNEMNEYIEKMAPLVYKILNKRNQMAGIRGEKVLPEKNRPHRFVNSKFNDPEIARYYGLTPSLAKEALTTKNNILQNINSQKYLSNQFVTLNERLMGIEYNENNNPFCTNSENESSSTNSIKYRNLERSTPTPTPGYTRHTTASQMRSRKYGGKKRTTAIKGKKRTNSTKGKKGKKSKKAKKRVTKK